MFNIVDRRLNPRGKSLSNRQRFIQRVKKQLKQAVADSFKNLNIEGVKKQEKVRISTDSIEEPHFRQDGSTGDRTRILPGNKEFLPGDIIERPPTGQGGKGNNASPDGEGDDQFEFILSYEEYLNILFEDMALPDFVKQVYKTEKSRSIVKAGFSKDGSPSNLSLKLTLKNSFGRRLALKRPSKVQIQELEDALEALKNSSDIDSKIDDKISKLEIKLDSMRQRLKIIPYFDNIDIRFNNFRVIEKPISQAVMFCLMDVSGSMGETHKELAKRFFLLLHLFLKRQYQAVELVFIRHTHVASEVDEQTFFYSKESGGTIVSTALEVMNQVIIDRYPTDEWNIYAAQASDGDNMNDDNATCQQLLEEHILPKCQYFAYIEIWDLQEQQIFNEDRNVSLLWKAYEQVHLKNPKLAMNRVTHESQIFSVLHDLFSPKKLRD